MREETFNIMVVIAVALLAVLIYIAASALDTAAGVYPTVTTSCAP